MAQALFRVMRSQSMANVPKRQKTLLGYFNLYESGKPFQCLAGSICQAQAQDSNTGSIKTGLETSVVNTQPSGHAMLADSMRHKPSPVLLDQCDGAVPVQSRVVIGPVSQLAKDTVPRSESTCSVSHRCTAADSLERSKAISDNSADVNQYEQQVQQPHVHCLARALHQSC